MERLYSVCDKLFKHSKLNNEDSKLSEKGNLCEFVENLEFSKRTKETSIGHLISEKPAFVLKRRLFDF